MSYSEKNEERAEKKAMLLFSKIRDELDPQHFTVEEIFEEGLDSVLYSRISNALRSNKSFCLGRINRAVNRLIAMRMIEKCDDEEDSGFRIVND